MAGLLLAPPGYASWKVVEELVLIAETTSPEEWQEQIVVLPL